MLTHEFNDMLMKIFFFNHTSPFLDNVYSNSFFPYINISTRHTSQSKTSIDNILDNSIN